MTTRDSLSERPFADLPAALVEEVLDRTEDISQTLLETLNQVRRERTTWRAALEAAGLLKHESDLGYPPIPTTCGVDGSYAIERLLTTDLATAAAVAVEGLTPPSETRHWPEPKHLVTVDAVRHDPDVGVIVRALMMGMELELAALAPHGVVFVDGSLTTPLIYLNQALNKALQGSMEQTTCELRTRVLGFLAAYRIVLASRRSDRCWVGVPKYTTRREIGDRLGWTKTSDDRGLLSSILSPGEFTTPQPLESPGQPWHVNLALLEGNELLEARRLEEEIIGLLSEVHVFYYRPYPWLPALRLETSRSVARTPGRLAGIVCAVRHQCGSAAIMEPYPLYMADRMVKHLARAVPTFRQVTSQRIAETYNGIIDDVFLGLHAYRTEAGR